MKLHVINDRIDFFRHVGRLEEGRIDREFGRR